MRTLILCALVLATHSLYSQAYFLGQDQRPYNSTTRDSIVIIDSISFPESGITKNFKRISRLDSIITIEFCFRDRGGAQIPIVKSDTTNLGVLPIGTYLCRAILNVTHLGSDTGCMTEAPYDTIISRFTVTNPTSLPQIEIKNLELFPNPTNGTLGFNVALHEAEIEISDMTGRVYETSHTEREIDVSGLAKGVYTLRLRNKDGLAIKRFIKE